MDAKLLDEAEAIGGKRARSAIQVMVNEGLPPSELSLAINRMDENRLEHRDLLDGWFDHLLRWTNDMTRALLGRARLLGRNAHLHIMRMIGSGVPAAEIERALHLMESKAAENVQ
ncbi:conserved hypothetical protein [delta proteobacterium NaphS2]|nr:conserved hypothetical protein [delta proteobacterium NaphS2]